MPTKTLHERIADAVLHVGSKRYVSRSGAMLTLMSELAEEGDLSGLSRAYVAYTTLVPADARSLADAVPGKVLNRYIYIFRQCPSRSVEQWQRRNPCWSEELKAALSDPVGFEALGRSMGDDAGRDGVPTVPAELP